MEVLAQEDFAGGMVRDVAPTLIDPRGVYDVRNMVLGEDGSLKRRGGGENITSADFGDGLTFAWAGQMSVGQRTVVANSSDFGVLDGTSVVNLGSDGLPRAVRPAYLAGLLFIPGGYIYAGSKMAANYSTGTVSVTNGSKTVTGSGVTWSSLVDAGMMLQLGNGRLYVVASITDSTHLELRDAYEGSTASGQAYTLRNIYKITAADPYEASDHYCAVQNKLLWADGEKVRFTKDTLSGGPHTYSATEDYDDLPDGANVVGLAAAGDRALIFSTGGLWSLSGIGYDTVSDAGDPQHRLDKLSEDLVLFGDAGFASWEQMVIAPCTSGVFLLDGISSPIKLSQNVEPLYTHYTDGNYRAGGAAVYKGHYLLPITSGGSTVETLVCRLDRSALDRRRKAGFPWVRFDQLGGEMRGFTVQVQSDIREPVLIGAGSTGRVVDASYLLNPDSDHVAEADGTAHRWSVVTRDFTLDGMTLTRFRYLRLLYKMDEGSISADYGDGTRIDGTPLWGHVEWGHFLWSSSEEAEFRNLRRDNLPDSAGPDAGLNPHRWRVGKRRRRVRFRLRGNDAGLCTLRQLEVLTAPPATRRR